MVDSANDSFASPHRRKPLATLMLRRTLRPAIVCAGVPRRHLNTDKIVVGACAACATSFSTVGIFHLIVVPVSPFIALATIGAATASGALAAIEGGQDQGGSSFGAVVGLFFGAIGCHYAKTSKEPWRK